MTKIYRYDNLVYNGKGTDNLIFKVKFISDGNFGPTIVNIPGDNDPVIANSDKCSLGPLKDLTEELTIVVSDIANPIPQEDTIEIEYYINDKLIQSHKNDKTEADRPMIILVIKFTAS